MNEPPYVQGLRQRLEWTQQWIREERKVSLLLAKQVANLTNELNKGVAPTDADTIYNAAHAGLIQERKEHEQR